ncbi:DUF6270 domain-containing protein [Priestia megaterium]|uniref:DUF6270 domain-containing protein n=1 Tax=Priestia megaterium TaxID=1404 RepID=UPI001C22CCFE|nr:DUF6270 domain-containing protein [Priestia megaterium]MBU8752341.1 hypothetical protein [Priestia megaterium]
MSILIDNIKYKNSTLIEMHLNVPSDIQHKSAQLLVQRRNKNSELQTFNYTQPINLAAEKIVIDLLDLNGLKGNSVSTEEIFDVIIHVENQAFTLEIAPENKIQLPYMTTMVWGTHSIKPYMTKKRTLALYSKAEVHVQLTQLESVNEQLECTFDAHSNHVVIDSIHLKVNGLIIEPIDNKLNETIGFKLPMRSIVRVYEAQGIQTLSVIIVSGTTVVECGISTKQNFQLSDDHYAIQVIPAEEGIRFFIKQHTKPKVKVAILGSCVTRDNFNSKFNANYKEVYECVLLQNQSALVSIMGKEIPFPSEQIDQLNDWDTWNVKTDFEKTFLKDLQQEQPDFLIIDLFGDVFFGCIAIGDSFVTNNYWKLGKTSYFKNLEKPKAFTLQKNFEGYMDIWRKSVDKLFLFLKTNLPHCKVIINQARFTDRYYDKEHNIQTIASPLDVEKGNNYWDQLDQYILDHFDVATINLTDRQFLSVENHPWGPFHVHFEMDYYQEFLQKLHEIVLGEYFHHNQTVFKNVYNELNGN